MRVIFDRPQHQAPTLFAGHAWMDAAEAWAVCEGDLVITRWTVDQRFAVGNQWFRIEWDGGEWKVSTLEVMT